MLLVVGWSAVVVWLNVRPRVEYRRTGELDWHFFNYGLPFTIAGATQVSVRAGNHTFSPRFTDYIGNPDYRSSYWGWLLAANIAIGLVAVAVLTFASKYLLRAMVAGLRGPPSKPPPDKRNGPSKSN